MWTFCFHESLLFPGVLFAGYVRDMYDQDALLGSLSNEHDCVLGITMWELFGTDR